MLAWSIPVGSGRVPTDVMRSNSERRTTCTAVLSCALWLCSAGAAVSQTAPLVLYPPAPPAGVGPTALALQNAYGAANRASSTDPAAALRATFAYQAALARLQMGDAFGARAEAARAQGLAGAAGIGTTIPLLAPLSPSGSMAPSTLALPPSTAIPLAGSPLPSYILYARNRIWNAQDRGVNTASAARHLRNAIDAYVDGNRARAQSEARAATEALPNR
jgi:hypothetical protein